MLFEDEINYWNGSSDLCGFLVASTSTGICAIYLGDDLDKHILDLRSDFPGARLTVGSKGNTVLTELVEQHIASPGKKFTYPLDMRAADFEQMLWAAIRASAPGDELSVPGLTKAIGGSPSSTSAVEGLIGASKLAIAVPCHRVVATEGSAPSYRWGEEIKRALLEREVVQAV